MGDSIPCFAGRQCVAGHCGNEALPRAFRSYKAGQRSGELLTYIWIAIGSALGGMSRYGISRAVALQVGETFPWGTLAVNIAGSFIIGFIAALFGPDSRLFISPNARNFLMVGFCGGFTTFSSFSLQTLDLFRNRDFGEAFGNILLSVAACMAAVAIGFILGEIVSNFRSSAP
jgi:CrcB protein